MQPSGISPQGKEMPYVPISHVFDSKTYIPRSPKGQAKPPLPQATPNPEP